MLYHNFELTNLHVTESATTATASVALECVLIKQPTHTTWKSYTCTLIMTKPLSKSDLCHICLQKFFNNYVDQMS